MGTNNYSVDATQDVGGQVGIRAVVAQDRILNIEKKFFCDRTTEKTVSILVSFCRNLLLPSEMFHSIFGP